MQRYHKKAGERVASSQKLATRGEEERRFSSDKQVQEQGIQRNKARGQLLAVWDREPQHAQQFCGERQLEVHVSLRNLGDNSSRDWECFFVNGPVCSECVSPPTNHDSHVPLACRTIILKQNQEERSRQCLRYGMFGSSAAQAL